MDTQTFHYVLISISAYWITGILSKGFFEPLQAYIAKKLLSKANSKIKDALADAVTDGIQGLDDIFLQHAADYGSELMKIIDPPNVSAPLKDKYFSQLSETYDTTILFSKIKSLL